MSYFTRSRSLTISQTFISIKLKLIPKKGIPNGVVNMVFGYGNTVGEAIVTHPDVPLISFTGSTATGKHIAIKTAPFLKKLSLEMGGKNAAVVFEDIDLEKVMPQIIRSSFLNSGEICLASSRIYVERSVYNKFVEKFTEEAL
jgi:acyl-CoA reductase-like NAD-dependent aldehyde dehydrogenase